MNILESMRKNKFTKLFMQQARLAMEYLTNIQPKVKINLNILMLFQNILRKNN